MDTSWQSYIHRLFFSLVMVYIQVDFFRVILNMAFLLTWVLKVGFSLQLSSF